MRWQDNILKNFRLYGVTDIKKYDERICARIATACNNGVDVIQLRSKTISDNEMMRLGNKIRRITAKHKVLFFVNDRADIALALKADGVHVGQDDMPVHELRRLFIRTQSRMFIGKSTHDLSQAMATVKESVDYIGVGPIFKTPTKAHYVPVGVDLIQKVSARVKKPFVCIGGINNKNIVEVCNAGARRVAVVRALFDVPNTGVSTRKLRKVLDMYGNKN